MRKSEYFDEKLQPGCKISNQKRNCEVGVLTSDENAFNKTRILKIVEDPRREFASGIVKRTKVRCLKAGGSG